MASCDGCIISARGMQEALSNARTKARQMAVRDGRPVALVLDENEYKLFDAFFAFENHYDVKEVVSHL
jgi:hypothetical protein